MEIGFPGTKSVNHIQTDEVVERYESILIGEAGM